MEFINNPNIKFIQFKDFLSFLAFLRTVKDKCFITVLGLNFVHLLDTVIYWFLFFAESTRAFSRPSLLDSKACWKHLAETYSFIFWLLLLGIVQIFLLIFSLAATLLQVIILLFAQKPVELFLFTFKPVIFSRWFSRAFVYILAKMRNFEHIMFFLMIYGRFGLFKIIFNDFIIV